MDTAAGLAGALWPDSTARAGTCGALGCIPAAELGCIEVMERPSQQNTEGVDPVDDPLFTAFE
jgi:hypothetical protein